MEHAEQPVSISGNLRRVRALLSRRRKLQLVALSFLLIISSVFEILTLSSVAPFMAAMLSPESLQGYPIIGPVLALLGLETPEQIRTALALFFAGFATLSAAVRLLYQWVSIRVALGITCDLSEHSFSVALSREWTDHVREDSSTIITSVRKVQSVNTSLLAPLLRLVGAGVISVSIIGTLLVVEPVAMFGIIGVGVLFYGGILLGLRRRTTEISRRLAQLARDRLKTVQSALGGLREIILDGSATLFIRQFRRIVRRMAADQAFIGVSSSAPRLIMEWLLVMGLVTVSLLNASAAGSSIAEALPKLAFLAFGALRLLPAAQIVFASFMGMRAGQAAVCDALDLAERPLSEVTATQQPALPFAHEICFKDVWFRYAPDLPWVLQGVDLTIRRGERIGVIGVTGSGKSSLIDLFMGLLRPSKGEITVDGTVLRGVARRRWMKRIAHVPQTVFLSDQSVEDNITFGLKTKDSARVREAAAQAEILDLVENDAGERGIRLSGGQRQRVGLARALYRAKDVIVLDEATSALDDATERKIMNTLDAIGEDITVVMIAHRLSTLRNCNRIIELEAGRIKRIVDGYENL